MYVCTCQLSFAIFLLKVICDASFRLVIFGAWMFSTNLTVAYYYGMMTLMLIINVTFCYLEKERIWSLRNLIGKHIVSKTSKRKIYKLKNLLSRTDSFMLYAIIGYSKTIILIESSYS